MAYRTFPPDVIGPSYPIQKSAQPKIIKVEFGDGYTQETPDGINFLMYEWNLNWEVLILEEKQVIENFLVQQGGYKTFLWTDDMRKQYRVKCRSWQVEEFEPTIFKITATFTQVPL